MGGACGTYGGEHRYVQGFGGEALRDRDHLEGPDVKGKKILRLIIQEVERGGMD
jgi:hypothetical protein